MAPLRSGLVLLPRPRRPWPGNNPAPSRPRFFSAAARHPQASSPAAAAVSPAPGPPGWRWGRPPARRPAGKRVTMTPPPSPQPPPALVLRGGGVSLCTPPLRPLLSPARRPSAAAGGVGVGRDWRARWTRSPASAPGAAEAGTPRRPGGKVGRFPAGRAGGGRSANPDVPSSPKPVSLAGEPCGAAGRLKSSPSTRLRELGL